MSFHCFQKVPDLGMGFSNLLLIAFFVKIKMGCYTLFNSSVRKRHLKIQIACVFNINMTNHEITLNKLMLVNKG